MYIFLALHAALHQVVHSDGPLGQEIYREVEMGSGESGAGEGVWGRRDPGSRSLPVAREAAVSPLGGGSLRGTLAASLLCSYKRETCSEVHLLETLLKDLKSHNAFLKVLKTSGIQ